MTTHNETAALSVTVIAAPRDARCKWWCKVIHATASLPLPSQVDGANDIPGVYLRKGDDVELEPGDVLARGEAVDHRRLRGWVYDIKEYHPDGKPRRIDPFGAAELKALIKRAAACGVMTRERAKELLGGSGDVAALVRWLHVRREYGTAAELERLTAAAEATREGR